MSTYADDDEDSGVPVRWVIAVLIALAVCIAGAMWGPM